MTDVSTTWAEIIFRVKWIAFVSRWCLSLVRWTWLVSIAMTVLAERLLKDSSKVCHQSLVGVDLSIVANDSLSSEDDWIRSAQVVETSVTNNSSFRHYAHPDDHIIHTTNCLCCPLIDAQLSPSIHHWCQFKPVAEGLFSWPLEDLVTRWCFTNSEKVSWYQLSLQMFQPYVIDISRLPLIVLSGDL